MVLLGNGTRRSQQQYPLHLDFSRTFPPPTLLLFAGDCLGKRARPSHARTDRRRETIPRSANRVPKSWLPWYETPRDAHHSGSFSNWHRSGTRASGARAGSTLGRSFSRLRRLTLSGFLPKRLLDLRVTAESERSVCFPLLVPLCTVVWPFRT